MDEGPPMFAPLGWLSKPVTRDMYRLFRSSDFFDATWYRHQHRGEMARWQDPIWHFIRVGWKKGLSPSALFDTAYYLDKNDDVRVARLNPLYHYLAHGQEERRLPLRSAKEAVNHFAPEMADIRAFTTPALNHKRVSLLFDSEAQLNDSLSYEKVVAAGISLAQSRGSSLRLLMRGVEADLQALDVALSGVGAEFLRTLEIMAVPLQATYSDIPFFADELCVATSFSSAQALRYSSHPERAWILTSEVFARQEGQEELSLPHDNPRFADLRLMRNILETREHLALAAPEWVTQPPYAPLLPYTRAARSDSEWRIRIACDPHHYPLHFHRGIEGLSSWLMNFAGSTAEIDIQLDGDGTVPFSFYEEFRAPLARGRKEKDSAAHCVVLLHPHGHDAVSKLIEQGIAVVSLDASLPLDDKSHAPSQTSAGHLRVPPRSSSVARALAALWADSLHQGTDGR